MIETQVHYVDTATPFFRRLAKEAPSEFRKAIKSAGWWLREEIKVGIKTGAPARQPYTPFSDVTTQNLLHRKKDVIRGKGLVEKYVRVKRRRPHTPLGRLHPATRYKYYSDSNSVIIGWISKSAEELGLKHELSYTYRVTEKMRRYFAASGIPLSKGKTTIKIPKRQTVTPVYKKNAPKIPGYIDEKVRQFVRKTEATAK